MAWFQHDRHDVGGPLSRRAPEKPRLPADIDCDSSQPPRFSCRYNRARHFLLRSSKHPTTPSMPNSGRLCVAAHRLENFPLDVQACRVRACDGIARGERSTYSFARTPFSSPLHLRIRANTLHLSPTIFEREMETLPHVYGVYYILFKGTNNDFALIYSLTDLRRQYGVYSTRLLTATLSRTACNTWEIDPTNGKTAYSFTIEEHFCTVKSDFSFGIKESIIKYCNGL